MTEIFQWQKENMKASREKICFFDLQPEGISFAFILSYEVIRLFSDLRSRSYAACLITFAYQTLPL